MSGVENIQRRRSFIFCPGDKPEMFAKALGSGADIVCVDLEDAIAPQHKNMSRENTLRLFKRIIRTPEDLAIDLQILNVKSICKNWKDFAHHYQNGKILETFSTPCKVSKIQF